MNCLICFYKNIMWVYAAVYYFIVMHMHYLSDYVSFLITFVNRNTVRGIIHLHDNEIVHGGIRPHNILVKTYQTIHIVPKSGGMSKCKIWKYFILICDDYSICIEEQRIVHSGSLQYGPYYFN